MDFVFKLGTYKPLIFSLLQTGGFHTKPLEGYVVVDFTNVLAGPNCGRMLSELGATVYKIEPHNPQHPPMVMVAW